jgi:hypothetical protein
MDYPEKVKQIYENVRGGRSAVTATELMSADVPYPANGDRWGKWELDAKRLVLVFDGHYEIDLEMIISSAGMLDWIYQINGKTWAERKDIGDLVQAFEDLFHPQGTLCSMGIDKKLNASEFLRAHLGGPAI